MKNEDSTSPERATRDARQLTRREMLGLLGVGTVGATLGSAVSSPLQARPTPVPTLSTQDPSATPPVPKAHPFDLADVVLSDGPFADARERDARYLLYLDPDRLLHNFRTNAGLEPKAPVYGGWESEEPWVSIRCHGHTLGHWLSASSLMYASTGDRELERRIDYAVDELKACQDAGGTGLVCAFPDGAEQLENAVSGKRFIGVPWYTMHKILAGLRDAYIHGGNETALDVLVKLTDWTWKATRPLSPEGFEQMLQREHGGMNEVCADVHVLTGDPRYLTLAEQFSHKALLIPLSQGKDILDGLHSNTQIPRMIGFQVIWMLTGQPEYGKAARFFWDRVANHRSWATGGNGDVEHFFPPDEFEAHLESAKTMETCCAYNILRLTRALFQETPNPELADFYERALFNDIHASQDPDSGMCTYFQAVRPGYLKLYHTPIDSFWCCTGTGMENHAKYNDSIYFHGDEALWVNLFIPSVAHWKEKGLTVTQKTSFPEEEQTRLSIASERPVRATLQVRHPSWCGGMSVTVNGKAIEAGSEPGSYVAIEREWRSGDTVEVALPMTLRTVPLPGAPTHVAIAYGPIVLAGLMGRDALYPGADILRNERVSGELLNVPVDVPVLVGDPDTLTSRIRKAPGAPPLTFETVGLGRPRDVRLVPYYRVAHERYNMYWSVKRA